MNIVKSVAVWVCLVPAAMLNGGLREYALAPTLGERWALPASGISLSLLIFGITWLLLPRVGRLRRRDEWRIGALWGALTVLFECAFGIAEGLSPQELLSAYNPMTGNLWLLVLTTTVLSPVLVAKSNRVSYTSPN